MMDAIDYHSIFCSSQSEEEFIANTVSAVLKEYESAFPEERETLTFAQGREHYVFDASSKELPDHEARTVFVWARVNAPTELRDSSYQRGYPIKSMCAGRPLDRGHFIPFSGGGSFGPNMFQQDRALNRGWSLEGRSFRALEVLAARSLESLYFVRPCYSDNSAFPNYLETGVLVGGQLTIGRYRNRFDESSLAVDICSEDLLDIMLPAMTSSDIGLLGEETAAVWLETRRGAILVSLEDVSYHRGDGLNDLDIVAILGEELICYEIKTSLFAKTAGRLTKKGNLFAPKLKKTRHLKAAHQASQSYVKERLDHILDTDPEHYDGVESRVIAVDLKAMLIQEFFCNDAGRIAKPVDLPSPCRDEAVEALDRLRDYYFSR